MVLRSPEDELIGCPNCVMYCAAKPMVPADNTLNIIKYVSLNSLNVQIVILLLPKTERY